MKKYIEVIYFVNMCQFYNAILFKYIKLKENNLLNTNLVYQNINMMNNNIPDQIYIIIMLLHVTIVRIT